jgi:hypothetical protein
MIAFILDFLTAVFLIRLVLWVAQLFLTSGRTDGGGADGGRGGGASGSGGVGDAMWDSPSPGGRAARRGQPSIDRSSVIDVPFTEIPPEGGAVPGEVAGGHDDPSTHGEDNDAHDDIPARSAAGDR